MRPTPRPRAKRPPSGRRWKIETPEDATPSGRVQPFADGQPSTLRRYHQLAAWLPRHSGSIETRLGSLANPTLIVHGDADERIPVECSHRLNELIPNSELHVIPGAGHGLMTNVPELMRELVLEFLSRSALDPCLPVPGQRSARRLRPVSYSTC